MTCKKCIHYELCNYMKDEYGVDLIPPSTCYYFQDKSKHIELPCLVRDKVYAYCKTVNQIVPYEIEDIHIDKEQTRYFATAFDIYYNEFLDEIEFNEDNIGQTVFLTKQDAEAKLKEMREND